MTKDDTLRTKPIKYKYEPSADGKTVSVTTLANGQKHPYSVEALTFMARSTMPLYMQEMAQGALDYMSGPQAEQDLSTITITKIHGHNVYQDTRTKRWFVIIGGKKIRRSSLTALDKAVAKL